MVAEHGAIGLGNGTEGAGGRHSAVQAEFKERQGRFKQGGELTVVLAQMYEIDPKKRTGLKAGSVVAQTGRNRDCVKYMRGDSPC